MIRLLRRLAAESPRLLALGIATAVAQTVLLLPIAALVRRVFDEDIVNHDTGAIVRDGLLILALYCATAGLGYLSRLAVLRTITAAAAKLRVELVSKVHELSQSWHDTQRAGLVQSLIVQDSQRVEDMFRDMANPLVPATLVGVALTVVALVVSPVLFLALVLVLPVFTTAAVLLARRSRRRARRWLDSARNFGAEVQLTLRATTLTKVEGAEERELQRGRRAADELAADARSVEAARAAHAGVQAAVGAVAGSLVLIVGGVAVARDSITLGDLLAFYAVLALLIRQLHAVGTGAGTVTIGLESLKKLEALLDTPADDPYADGTRKLDFVGGITLEDVTFAYSDEPILHEVDLVIEPSERVAILGPNGAGKSTLVALMIGLYAPQTGRVLADGAPFDDIDMRHLRRQIGVVLQDPVLVPGTIRENIAYGRPDATEAEIRAAAAAATADVFIGRLPDGYDTQLGDEGVGLSGGQRQRVAIARALLGEPGLLLLDEPTTYLDEAGVTTLIENLSALPRSPTVVLVTHDPQATVHADRTIELRDGRIASDSAPPVPWHAAGG